MIVYTLSRSLQGLRPAPPTSFLSSPMVRVLVALAYIAAFAILGYISALGFAIIQTTV